jgi:hypothetical protein
MKGREKPHMEKWREMMNNSNCDGGCTATSLMVFDLEKFRPLIFIERTVLIFSLIFP